MNLQLEHIQAGNELTTKKLLRKLSNSQDCKVRLRLAENPASPVDTLVRLAKDPNAEIRASVASNPATPKDIVRTLANDENDDVRLSMASDPHQSLEILAELGNDRNPYIRICASKTLEAVALELDLKHEGFVGLLGAHGRLGELLVAAGIVEKIEMEKHASKASALSIPLGRALLQAGLVDRGTIVYALKHQTLVRLGQIALTEAIEKISAYVDRLQAKSAT